MNWAGEIRQSRTSIIILLLGIGSVYYSTQIQLNYGFRWWNMIIAGVGVILFAVSMVMLYKDRDHEKTYRRLLRRAKRVEVRTGEKEVMQMRESEGDAATALDEDEEMEVSDVEVPKAASALDEDEEVEVTEVEAAKDD